MFCTIRVIPSMLAFGNPRALCFYAQSTRRPVKTSEGV